MALSALVLNCTLKPGPATSNTELLANEMVTALKSHDVSCQTVRLVDLNIMPGVDDDMGQKDGKSDDWPEVYAKVKAADILVIATPTWLGQASSVCQRALERLDAMIRQTDDAGKPLAYDKVCGVVVTGNEDGAHHIIATTSQALVDIGYTFPAQAWTYWHMGPGPGPNYSDDEATGHDWSIKTAKTAAANLASAAQAFKDYPLPAPAS